MSRRAPASGRTDDPLRPKYKGQRVTTPILWKRITKAAATHFHPPLPDLSCPQGADSATEERGSGDMV